MKRIIAAGVVAIAVAVAGSALAADGAAIFKAKCVACHGAEGAGTAMAPAFKGNAFVRDSKNVECELVVTHGRKGDEKKHKNFAMAMPSHEGKLSADEIKAVVDYIKTLAK
ncbi:MAG: cytochrome c [Deltaproteobacteria bacterium]|nr:cytochrome c [Deltaproteobacteria bacterium]